MEAVAEVFQSPAFVFEKRYRFMYAPCSDICLCYHYRFFPNFSMMELVMVSHSGEDKIACMINYLGPGY